MYSCTPYMTVPCTRVLVQVPYTYTLTLTLTRHSQLHLKTLHVHVHVLLTGNRTTCSTPVYLRYLYVVLPYTYFSVSLSLGYRTTYSIIDSPQVSRWWCCCCWCDHTSIHKSHQNLLSNRRTILSQETAHILLCSLKTLLGNKLREGGFQQSH